MSVLTKPGATTLAVMLREPSSRAARAGQADDRGDEDHPAAAHLHHALHGALGDPEGAGEVGVEDRGELLLAHQRQQLVLGDARVGDDDLDRALLRLDLAEGVVDVLPAGDVALDREEALGGFARPVGDGHGVTRGLQLPGDRESDAAVSAGDQD